MNNLTKKIGRKALQRMKALTPLVKEVKPGLPKVIVNSFPKSGTHLLSKLVGDLGFIELPILIRPTGYCDFSRPGTWNEWKPISENKVEKYGNPTYVNCRAPEVLARFREGQFAPTHFGRMPFVEKTLAAKKFKHLLIVRDLRDCVYSYVHHYLSLSSSFHRADWYYYLSALNNLEEQILAVIEGRDRFLNSYRLEIEKIEKWLGHPDVLVVCYEHLIGANGGGTLEDQRREIVRIVEFLEMTPDQTLIDRVARGLWGGGTRTFRSGKTGDWKDAFTPRVQDAFDRELGDFQAKVQTYIHRSVLAIFAITASLLPDFTDCLDLAA